MADAVNPSHSDDELRRILTDWKNKQASEFQPSPEELTFLQVTSGIQDEDKLKAHVVAVQEKAAQVFPYPCIVKFGFTRTRVSSLRGYNETLELGKRKRGALLLDIGCCFGADSRRAVLDGFPATQIMASDLHAEFWDLGHELFRDSQEKVPITFLAGDVFDRSFLSPSPPGTPLSGLTLPELTSLTPLHGRLSAIHASLFFHLFSRAKQEELAALLAGLLLHEKGSVIFGHQIGAEEEGLGQQFGRWAHNCESWRVMWEGALASVGWLGKADIFAELGEPPEYVKSQDICAGIGTHVLSWCVELL
ncbi:hypothetical protein CALVIDRAFT_485552 [Calocera viscosa TUFC12733]|uniref:Methyltransferase domain-containing protein n=1 Tax=Calocera viscosa (strain TUFC12733) TaxID=1330018 RepID=A0A167JHW7_CALVF|nr:hypothetical protein CALVIDRAFT_485552 [Calocera viscosa TUFC12733]